MPLIILAALPKAFWVLLYPFTDYGTPKLYIKFRWTEVHCFVVYSFSKNSWHPICFLYLCWALNWLFYSCRVIRPNSSSRIMVSSDSIILYMKLEVTPTVCFTLNLFTLNFIFNFDTVTESCEALLLFFAAGPIFTSLNNLVSLANAGTSLFAPLPGYLWV